MPINSFDKTFMILETVVLQRGHAVTPSHVAEITGINLVTCTRILSMLAKKGYLVQISSRQGYVPGPMCAALTTRPNVYSKLADAAREPLRNLSKMIHAQVNLSVICGTERVMILCECPLKKWPYWGSLRFPCEYGEAATDRLLSACREKVYNPERKRIIAERHVEFEEKSTGLIIMGELMIIPTLPVSAFGYGFDPALGVERIRNASKNAAREIVTLLTPEDRVF